MRRTKIMCTIGPATSSKKMIEALIDEGVDIFRLNFAHRSQEEIKENIEIIRKAASKKEIDVAICIDLQGPKIRVGKVKGGSVCLKEGKTYFLTTEPCLGDEKKLQISYKGFINDVEPGTRVLLDDGKIELNVIKKHPGEVECKIINGGILQSNKGVNLPDITLNLDSFTPKDQNDLIFSLNQDVDWISISFVRSSKDVEKVREVIEDFGSNVKVIVKIEKHEAITNINSIIEAAHGVMVARGDLGVEMPIEDVPKYQKMIINHSNLEGKPVIIATQMLESMIENPRPTRAEASDVANAVYDGASVVMLSAETAIGKYPTESVQIMSKIINSSESMIDYGAKMMEKLKIGYKSVTDSIALAACEIAKNLGAAAIITSTKSGHTARQISKNHPPTLIVAVSPVQRVVNQLKLSWGVYPIISIHSKNIDDMIDSAVNLALENGFISKGDVVVITAGVLVDRPGTTNMLKVHIV